jgi:hypothetical protein
MLSRERAGPKWRISRIWRVKSLDHLQWNLSNALARSKLWIGEWCLNSSQQSFDAGKTMWTQTHSVSYSPYLLSQEVYWRSWIVHKSLYMVWNGWAYSPCLVCAFISPFVGSFVGAFVIFVPAFVGGFVGTFVGGFVGKYISKMLRLVLLLSFIHLQFLALLYLRIWFTFLNLQYNVHQQVVTLPILPQALT